jgi:hypothetical protein
MENLDLRASLLDNPQNTYYNRPGFLSDREDQSNYKYQGF